MWTTAGNRSTLMKTSSFLSYIKRAHSTKKLPCAIFALTDLWPKTSIMLFDSRSRNLGRVNPVRPLTLSTLYRTQAAVASGDFGEASDPSPQGIQGDDCVNFRLWMESCRRYGLPGCDEQANHIVSGRKTISEVFLEQDQIIKDIARNYSQVRKTSAPMGANSEASRQGVQEGYGYCAPLVSSDSCVQGVQGLDILHSLVNVVSPQGIQGDECVQFKLWLENCHRFGISGECEQQLNSIKSGRKTLAQIFQEQDMLIRQIVREYKSGKS